MHEACATEYACDWIHFYPSPACLYLQSRGLSANHHRLPIDHSSSRLFSLLVLDALALCMHASRKKASPHPSKPPPSSVECVIAAGRRATPILRKLLNIRHRLLGMGGWPPPGPLRNLPTPASRACGTQVSRKDALIPTSPHLLILSIRHCMRGEQQGAWGRSISPNLNKYSTSSVECSV